MQAPGAGTYEVASGRWQPRGWRYPIERTSDYRHPEHREYGFLAYAEALYSTGELHQQLRLADWAIDQDPYADAAATREAKLWLAFLWGACYNVITPWVMLQRYGTVPQDESNGFTQWYNRTFDRHRFDTDCRYRKAKMLACVASYREWLAGRSQYEALGELMAAATTDERYQKLWAAASSWYTFGRLSVWNWIEAVEAVHVFETHVDCGDFHLEDVTGSESNRNGVACAIGRDDLVTHHGRKDGSGQTITRAECDQLTEEAERLFSTMQATIEQPACPVTRMNAETVFCWYKKMHSRATNSRYLGWDGDRTWDELRYLEAQWPDYPVLQLWAARAAMLPSYLRAECSPPGIERGPSKRKMGIYVATGTMPDVYYHQRGEGYYLPQEAPRR